MQRRKPAQQCCWCGLVVSICDKKAAREELARDCQQRDIRSSILHHVCSDSSPCVRCFAQMPVTPGVCWPGGVRVRFSSQIKVSAVAVGRLGRGGRAQNLSRDHKPELKSERRRITQAKGRGVGVGSDAIPHLLHACFNAKSSRTQAGGFVSADGRVDGNLADSPGKVRARERESAEPSPSLQNLSRSLGDFAYKKDASRKAPLHCAKTFRGMNLEAK